MFTFCLLQNQNQNQNFNLTNMGTIEIKILKLLNLGIIWLIIIITVVSYNARFYSMYKYDIPSYNVLVKLPNMPNITENIFCELKIYCNILPSRKIRYDEKLMINISAIFRIVSRLIYYRQNFMFQYKQYVDKTNKRRYGCTSCVAIGTRYTARKASCLHTLTCQRVN